MGDVHWGDAGPETRRGESTTQPDWRVYFCFCKPFSVFFQDLYVLKGRISDQTVTFTKRSFLFQCINNLARKMGMNRSLDLPDKTLQFIRDRPLMDEAVRPLSGGPLLVRKGALLTRIVVDRVLALDGQTHAVMFVGTGWNLDRL